MSQFDTDYDLASLMLVKPSGTNFEMFVTPRFIAPYSYGYEPLSTALVAALAPAHDVFIDVGAHYGYYALTALCANENVRAIAIEPVESNFVILQRNIALKESDRKRTKLVHAAVSDVEGDAHIQLSQASDNCSFYNHPASGNQGTQAVKTVSLESIISELPTSRILIKIDTDGHELQVLKGLEGALGTGHDFSFLFESNPKMFDRAGLDFKVLSEWFEEKGYSLYAIDEETHFVSLRSAEAVKAFLLRYRKNYFNVVALRQTESCLITLVSHTGGLDGAGRSLLDFAAGLTRLGNLCNLVVPYEGPLSEEARRAGCGILVAPPVMSDFWWMTRQAQRSFEGEIPFALLESSFEQMCDSVAFTGSNIVVTQSVVSPWGAAIAEHCGLPHVLSAREFGVADHQLDFVYGFEASLSALAATSEKIFSISAAVAEHLFGGDFPKGEVIYSGFDIEGIQKSRHLKDDRFSPRKPMICMPATIQPGKGQLDLVEALAHLARKGIHVHATFLGHVADQGYMDLLQRRVDEAGLTEHCEFHAFRSDVYGIMSQADVVVSCSRNEALGRTMFEASILDRPIVYAREGGIVEVFTEDHGLSYKPGDHFELASKIESILLDPEGAAARVRNASSLCRERFTRMAFAARALPALRAAAQTGRRVSAGRRPMLELLSQASARSVFVPTWRPRLFWADSVETVEPDRFTWCDPISGGPFRIDMEFEPGQKVRFVALRPIERFACELVLSSVTAEAESGRRLHPDEFSLVIEDGPVEINTFSGVLSATLVTGDSRICLQFPEPIRHITIVGQICARPVDLAVGRFISLASDARHELDRARKMIADYDAQAQELGRQLAVVRSDSDSLRAEIDRARVLIMGHRAQQDHTTALLQACEARLQKSRARVKAAETREAALRASWSWKLSWPVRGAGRAMRWLRHRIGL